MPHVLLATDADWLVDQVTAALGGPDTSFTVVREGRLVCKVVGERQPDLRFSCAELHEVELAEVDVPEPFAERPGEERQHQEPVVAAQRVKH